MTANESQNSNGPTWTFTNDDELTDETIDILARLLVDIAALDAAVTIKSDAGTAGEVARSFAGLEARGLVTEGG